MIPLLSLLTVFCAVASTGSLSDSLLDGNVTFKLPAHWSVQQRLRNRAAEVLQLMVPDPDTDATPDSSNVAITTEPLQPGVTVQSFGDSRLRGGPSLTVLTDIPAGKTWRTVLSRSQQGKTPYVVLDRFGVDAGYMVALRISFPVIQRKNAHWIARMVADCNALIESLKIRGKNVITSELNDDEGVIWLRDFKEGSTDWGFYPTDVEYFPANIFGDFMTPSLGGMLAEMGEPSLLDSTDFPKSAEIYRFTWLSAFHGNLVVRICILADQSATVSVKGYDGGDPKGCGVGTKTHESLRALRQDELNQVRSQFASFPYDQMAAWVPGLSGLDGAIWLFEWRTSASPHVIARWSPNGIWESFTREEFNKLFPNLDYDKHRTEFTRFADLCTAFSRMADFKVNLY